MTTTPSAAQVVDEFARIGVALWIEEGKLRFRAARGVMTEPRLARLRERRDEIVEHLSADGGPPQVVADPAHRHEPFPLTDVQAAYLLGRSATFDYGGVACHGYGELSYPELDTSRMTAAWRTLIARHDMLRAVVSADGSQRVLAEVPDYEVRAGDAQDEDDFEAIVAATRSQMDHQVRSPDVWPLFEARITRGPGRAILHLSIDFLIADFVSIQVLLDELHRLYHRPQEPLPPLEITYRDYLLAERSLGAAGRHERSRDYWLGRVDTLPGAPELPRASGAASAAGRFRRWAATMPADLWSQLKSLAGKHNVSPSIVVLAAYADTIAAWSRTDRFTLNVTLLNRLPVHPQVGNLIGDFTGVELLEAGGGGGSFAERARALQAQLWEDLDHRGFGGVEVMREIVRRKGSGAALFPVVYTSAIGLAGESDTSFGEMGYGISQTPQVFIDCQNMERGGELATNWDVREQVFPDGMIEDMFAAYRDLLWRLASDDEAWVGPAPLPLPSAQARRRAQVNDTSIGLPQGTLIGAVLAQAAGDPDRPAVIAGDETVTYRQLLAHAAGVAESLRAAGCLPGTGRPELVAITLRRGWRQVSAVLGTMLAGAAYLPIDHSSPPARQERILRSSGARFRIADTGGLPGEPVTVGIGGVEPAEAPRHAPAAPGDLAYVIHTSGSTGEPKGVMITHEQALNTVLDVNERFGIGVGDTVLGLSALGFDLSVWDVFGTLSVGGCLVVPDHERRADPSHWADLMVRHQVSVWNSVPAQLQMLAGYLATPGSVPVASLRLAMLSGDWIPVGLPGEMRSHLPELEIVSMGGATEASIWSIYYRVEQVPPHWASIPYGKPLANQTFHVLDARLRPCPDWVAGELHIGGAGVALGYLNDEQLTRERFITHPVTGERLYRTGDLGRYLPDGNIEFLGREDQQVKIRGHRIELAEADTALAAHPGVASAAVVVEGRPPAPRRLVGFAEPARVSAVSTALDTVTPVLAANLSVSDVDTDRYRVFADRLDRVALEAMLHALPLEPGIHYSEAEILAGARVAPRHHRLVRRWLRALVTEGRLVRDGEGYLLRQAAGDLAPAWKEVAEVALDSDAVLLDYFRTSTGVLPALLAGDEDPLRLLFPDGDLGVTQNLYEDAVFNRWANCAAAGLVAQLARAAQPATPAAERPLRVLEVGAGGGGTTAAMLAALTGTPFDYLVTDISPFLIEAAQKRFGDVPGLRFGLLDLDSDPLTQGLAPNHFDVVVAGDVLHATRDAGAALARLKELLRAGGWLVALEMTRDHYQIMTSLELLVRVDEATGDFADRRRGTDSVFLDRRAWQEMLFETGAQQQVCLPEPDGFIAELGMCVIAAQFKTDRARLDPAELAERMRERVPEHMVPSVINVIDALPLTGNGKVDRAELARRLPRQRATVPVNSAAMSDLERVLAGMWSEAVRTPVGRDSNLFQVGGDSLVAAQLTGRILEQVPQAHGWHFDELLRTLLDHPTVGGLAARLAQPRAAAEKPVTVVTLLEPVREGAGVPVIVVPDPGAASVSLRYPHLLADVADPQAPAWTLAVASYRGVTNLDKLAADVAQAAVDAGMLRLRLIGSGIAAQLAVALARSLTEQGALVESVSLVAPASPGKPAEAAADGLAVATAATEPPIYAGDLDVVAASDQPENALRLWEELCLGEVVFVRAPVDSASLQGETWQDEAAGAVAPALGQPR